MNQSALQDNQKLFFCFGLPKSGTTFLQRTLNLHPDISCPPEHKFNFIFKGLEELLKGYLNTLHITDRKTGGQGVVQIQQATFRRIARFTIESIINEAAKKGETIVGANDNTIAGNIESYNNIFNSPKMIHIFRNPADLAISGWHQNMRLTKEENNPSYQEHITQFGGFDGWVKQCAKWFAKDVNTYRAFSSNHKNILMVRYEDLVGDKRNVLGEIFDFLGTQASNDMLDSIEKMSEFSYMRNNSSNPSFFRTGSTNMGKGEISPQLLQDISKIAGDELRFLSYELK
jgi:hypothetical protein